VSKPVSQQKLLWHLTALDNLESILRKGLLSRSHIQDFIDVADQEIIQRRTQLGLNNYVPFHFFQGNPFDGSVLKAHLNKKFCFIVVKRDLARSKGYKILSKHPLSMDLRLYDYDEGMNVINWDVVDKRDYLDQECKVACMAECLAFGCVEPEDFFAITVQTNKDKLFVEHLSNSVLRKYNFFIDVKSYCFVFQGGSND
jgi:hypothetical protein